MRKFAFFLLVLAFSCKKEDPHHDHATDEGDTSVPVITLNSPIDSSVYNTGDTVFISGNVTDNHLHVGEIRIKDDTTSFIYFSADPNVHGLTNAPINFFYVVNVSQIRAVTLTVAYSDLQPNTALATRKLMFVP